MIRYLAKANNDRISHCACDFAVAGPPMQADCPWCGCGWMIGCMKCSKAFTYAKVVEEDTTYEELSRRIGLEASPQPNRIRVPTGWAKELLEHYVPGETLVYLDGMYWPVGATTLNYEGWFAKHDLARVPQLVDDDVQSILRNPQYWWDRERPNRHEDEA